MARLSVVFSGDVSNLDKAYARAKKLQSDFVRDASKKGTVKLDADSSGVTKGVDQARNSLGQFSKDSSVTVKQSDKLGGALSKLGDNSEGASGGMRELAGSLRAFSTVTAATAGLPAIIAGIGALPAVATAATGASAQLALGLGQGMAGAVAIGQTAFQSARVGIMAYTKLLSSTAMASRELYLEENKAAQKRIDAAKKTAFSTRANMDFNRSLDDAQIAFIKLQGAVSDKAFPFFTREIQAWTNLMPKFQDRIVNTAGSLAGIAADFSKWFRTADDGQMLNRIVNFINGSALRAARTLSAFGRTGLSVFMHLIKPAKLLQTQVLGVARSMSKWSQSADGARKLEGIVGLLQKRMYQLFSIVKNVGSGLIGVFTALNNQGGPDRLMKGLVGLSQGFSNLMEKGNGARQAIVNFMNRSDPLLNQMWKLVKTVVIQFGLLANNVVKAGQAGGKMGTLAKVVASLRKSVVPLRRLFQSTFLALGDTLAKLIPEVAKLAETFAGSTGPLVTFLQTIQRVLHVFNGLPLPVKTTIANLVALKAIMGGLGLGGLITGVGRLATQFWAMSRASKASALAVTQSNLAMKGTAAANTTATASTAAVAGRFGRLRTATKAAGGALLAFAGIASGGLVIALAAAVAAGVLIYKNWDKIKKAAQPLVKVFHAVMDALAPMARTLGRAVVDAMSSLAKGFTSAISPGFKMKNMSKGLAGVLGDLGKKVLPVVAKAFLGLSNFLDRHQGAFRTIGKVVGGVVVGGFKLWWRILQGGYVILRTIVKIVGSVIGAFNSLTKGMHKTGPATKLVVKGFRAIKDAWKNLGIKWEGSALQKMYKKMLDVTANVKKAVGKAFRELWSNLKNIWGDTFKSASNLWDKISGKITLKSDESKKKSGDRFRDLWDNLKNIWGDTFKAASNLWDKVANKVVDKSDESKQKSGDRFRELWDNLKNIWNGVFNAASSLWDKISTKIVDKNKEAKEKSGDRQRELEDNTKNVFGRILESVMNTMGNLAKGVGDTWKNIGDFAQKVMVKLGLKDDTSPIPSPKISRSKDFTKGGNGPGIPKGPGMAARGGLFSGRYNQDAAYMAMGGVRQGSRGGMANGREPRLVYGEAGPEAYVTLGRYTKESAEALNKANEVWARRGWLEKATKEHRHRDEGPSRRPGGRWGQGESLGPTHYNLNPEIKKRANDIANSTGTKWNTYVGHGKPGGSTEAYTADFWGSGGRGSPISKSAGYKTADLALDKHNSNPGVLYIIRQGQYWRGGNWSGNTYGDPHYDHTHVSWDSPGGAKASGGGSSGPVPNPKQEKLEKMWAATIDPWGKKWVSRMSPASKFHRGSGAGSVKGVDSIYSWLDEKIPDMIEGSGSSGGTFSGDWASAKGGSPTENMSIGKAAAKEMGWSSQWNQWQELGHRESGWNRTAKNSSSGAYGIPQALPESKLPSKGQSSGGSYAGPQVGWMADYMKERYGDPKGALAFHNKNNWYAKGGIIPGPKGKPVMIQAHSGERVLPERLTKSFDRLANSIEKWARNTRRSHRRDDDGPFGGRLAGPVRNVRREVRELRHEGKRDIERALDKHADRLERKLDKQLGKMLDAEDLLHMALRVQDSPAGVAGHVRRTKRIVNRELARIGG